MKIKLYNGLELNPIMVTGAHKFIQDANRDCLTFIFPETSLDELDKYFTESNCESIIIYSNDTDEKGNSIEIENVHSGYVIRDELTKKDVIIKEAAGAEASVTEKRCFVTMAQRTYAEAKLAEIEIQNMDTALAVAELGVMIAGGIK